MKSRKLSTPEELEKLKTMYLNDTSITIMRDQLKASEKIIYNRLKKMGVHVRGKTCLRRKCKYSLNSNYFESIDSEDKAYFLGFIGADGCVMKDKHNRLYLKFHQHEQDIDILEKFLQCLEANHPIKRDKSRSHIVSLVISDKKLISDLIKHGITFRKSLTYEFNNDIPQNLIPHYIRGYMDGDGCVFECKNNQKTKVLHEGYNVIGSCNFIIGLENYLKNNGIQTNSSICNKGNNRQFSITSFDTTLLFYNLIYKGCKITGLRKYNKAKMYH